MSAEPEGVPGVGVHRHSDGAECLWGVPDQKWYRMHPLYPLRGCDRSHRAFYAWDERAFRMAEAIHNVLESDYGKCDHNPDFSTGEPYAVCEQLAAAIIAREEVS